jgi:2-polyprenyl-6-methoxyphenol hydroxylase-like FAD-dependent oxidoreductase
MTLLGDSAHPMVPFMGQGGCMAIEDAYTFALLLKKLNLNFATAQFLYNKIRVSRNNKIQKMSMRQAKLNHIENHFFATVRNILMKNTNVISNRANSIWDYDAHDHIESELRKL